MRRMAHSSCAWFALSALAAMACGAPQGRPTLPPPEYEEPAPPTPTSSAPVATPTSTSTSIPTSTPTSIPTSIPTPTAAPTSAPPR
ncbi:MAG TPA: hypothetical protein VGL81_17420 [Polyangiaceae bacterium]|jgi:hypothetical protein